MMNELDDVIRLAELGDFGPLRRWAELAKTDPVLCAPQASEEQMLALEQKFALMLERSDKGRLWYALAFYADPATYLATSIVVDPPCGPFIEDQSYVEDYQREVPGKLARETLEALQTEATHG
jgi:hypothetical protein